MTQKERKGDTKKMDNPENRTIKDQDTNRKITFKGERRERAELNVTSLVNCPLQPGRETPSTISS